LHKAVHTTFSHGGCCRTIPTLYEYRAAPALWPTSGCQSATWTSSAGGSRLKSSLLGHSDSEKSRSVRLGPFRSCEFGETVNGANQFRIVRLRCAPNEEQCESRLTMSQFNAFRKIRSDMGYETSFDVRAYQMSTKSMSRDGLVRNSSNETRNLHTRPYLWTYLIRKAPSVILLPNRQSSARLCRGSIPFHSPRCGCQTISAVRSPKCVMHRHSDCKAIVQHQISVDFAEVIFNGGTNRRPTGQWESRVRTPDDSAFIKMKLTICASPRSLPHLWQIRSQNDMHVHFAKVSVLDGSRERLTKREVLQKLRTLTTCNIQPLQNG
jgi:hypothetical protein